MIPKFKDVCKKLNDDEKIKHVLKMKEFDAFIKPHLENWCGGETSIPCEDTFFLE
jgi:hypothetical protein